MKIPEDALKGEKQRQPAEVPTREKPRYEKPAITWRNAIDSRAISIGCAQSIPLDPACGSGSGGS